MEYPFILEKKNFLSNLDLTKEEVLKILDFADNIKNKKLKVQCNKKVLGYFK